MGVKTEKKDQATLIAELISRVTSLEEDMEFVLEHINTSPTQSNASNVLKSLEEKTDDCPLIEIEEWNSYSNGKIYAPKGTFQKIYDAERRADEDI